MPVILPHKLVPWMLEHGLYPMDAMDTNHVSTYWNHLGSRLPWACEHIRKRGTNYQPFWLWGDDAQYNEACDKLVTCCMGSVLDDRSSAICTVWPLFCYRFESRMHSKTLYLRSCGVYVSVLMDAVSCFVWLVCLANDPLQGTSCWIRNTECFPQTGYFTAVKNSLSIDLVLVHFLWIMVLR